MCRLAAAAQQAYQRGVSGAANGAFKWSVGVSVGMNLFPAARQAIVIVHYTWV
jgi:hypothetical protein